MNLARIATQQTVTDILHLGCPCRRVPGYEQPEDSRSCDCDCHFEDD